MLLSYDFDKTGKILTVYSYLSSIFSLSKIGVMSAVLRHGRNKEDFTGLFVLTYRKSLNMSELFLIILVRMSEC